MPLALFMPVFGAPLAVLAMLFPALFGGVILVFHSWKALISVASLNSTLLILYLCLGRTLENTWLAPPRNLWLVMVLITLAGTLWAWRRHLPAGTSSAGSPRRSEQVMLWLSAITFLGSFLFSASYGLNPEDPTWKLLLVLAVSFGVGILYTLARRCVTRPAVGQPALPTEGVILWAMAVTSICLGTTWPQGSSPMAGSFKPGPGARAGSSEDAVKHVVKPVWTFIPSGKIGMVVSSCLGYGHRVYAGAALRQGNEQYGVLYRLDAQTGKKVWEFDDGGDMKPVFSSPCIADGRLYVGEGFHTDPDCKLYCLNADTGKKLWAFPTGSHTESSPCVAAGKVYFGAGDDGVYCLDAVTGKKLWQYPGKDGDTTPTVAPRSGGNPGKRRLNLHVDSSPAVVGDRLYAGSGIGREAGEAGDPAVFCLDARTGKKLWLLPLEARNLPAWGSPAVAGDQLFFGIGNGDLLETTRDEKPAGALLCVDARTGRERWRYDIGNGVLNKPAVDETCVYFGGRDGFCYCVDRKDGRLRWKVNLHSPVVASPVLVRCRWCGNSEYLYALGSAGPLACLNPATGAVLWEYRFDQGPYLGSTPFVVADQTPTRENIRLYIGAAIGNRSVPIVWCLGHEPTRPNQPGK
jgi:outer membrane protein assembly factor BamB